MTCFNQINNPKKYGYNQLSKTLVMVQQDTKKKKGSMSNSENKHVLEKRSAEESEKKNYVRSG